MKVFRVRVYIMLALADGSWHSVFSGCRNLALLLLCLRCPVLLGMPKPSPHSLDPSGAVIVGARIEITGGELTQRSYFPLIARQVRVPGP